MTITKRRLISPAVAVLAVAAFAGTALAAPSTSFQAFGSGEVSMNQAGATLVNEAGEYSGIYVNSRSLNNKPLADVHVSFESIGDVAGGAPRFSLPLNTGVGSTPYAFLDVNNCATAVVSTDDDTCRVFINTGGSYENWDAFAAANPTWRISKTAIPFIIADQPGTYVITDVDVR